MLLLGTFCQIVEDLLVSCSWHEKRLGPRLWHLRPRTKSEYTPEHIDTATQTEHEDCGAGGKEETTFNKVEQT